MYFLVSLLECLSVALGILLVFLIFVAVDEFSRKIVRKVFPEDFDDIKESEASK